MRTFIGRYAAETQAAVQARNAAGDADVFYVDTDRLAAVRRPERLVHPNDAGHQAIADRLAPVLSARLTHDPDPAADLPRPATARSTPPPTAPRGRGLRGHLPQDR